MNSSRDTGRLSAFDLNQLKTAIPRLIEEAAQIAPSIVHFNKDKDFRRVDDSDLDRTALQTWELETNGVLRSLSNMYGSMFVELYDRHVESSNEDTRCESIKVIWAREKLVSALKLLDSPLLPVTPGAPLRRGAPIAVASSEKPDAHGVKKPVEPPEKITFRWLFDHVPIKIWAAGFGILIGSFLLGVRAAESGIMKALLTMFSRAG